MKTSDLPKNVSKSIRVNDEVLIIIEGLGYTAQSFFDLCINQYVCVSIEKSDEEVD